MMRLQRLSPLSNETNHTICKQGHIPNFTNSQLKSPNPTSNNQSPSTTISPDKLSDVDGLPQWGHNKRSRGPRAASSPAPSDEPNSTRPITKAHRRSSAEKASAIAAAMRPRGSNLRASMGGRSSVARMIKAIDDPSTGIGRSDKRPSQSPAKKSKRKKLSSSCTTGNPDSKQPSDRETGDSGAVTTTATIEKMNLDQFEWPRIYLSLSRKEKEDDFLAMKGTKLPHRPKKRAKNVDKTLQYCFPGMWLSDLTKSRYEVRERKCVKKLQRKRGLKGMESIESDSE